MHDLTLSFWRDESGGEMSDYALFLGLVALILVIAISAYRGPIQHRFFEAARTLSVRR
jgi:Flp pilus assembly pilin Flp